MVEFKVTPTASKRKLTRQVMKAIEKELMTCSPNYELSINVKIMEDHTKPIKED